MTCCVKMFKKLSPTKKMKPPAVDAKQSASLPSLPKLVRSASVSTADESDSVSGDSLEGMLELIVNLPDKRVVTTSVEKRMPMMDLLVNIATANKINPTSHVLRVVHDQDGSFLPFKASTPIGSLNSSVVYIVPKMLSDETMTKKGKSKTAQPFEPTFRLQIHLPRHQLLVLRVSSRIKLCDLHHMICTNKGFDPAHYVLQHPHDADMLLDYSLTLADYHLTEIAVAGVGPKTMKPCSFEAATDVKTLPEGSLAQKEREEKKRRTLFTFKFRKSKSSAGDSSSEDASSRGVSPARSDNSCRDSTSPSRPASCHSVRPPNKKRLAPPPPILNKTRSEKPPPPPPLHPRSSNSLLKTEHLRNGSDSSGGHEGVILPEPPLRSKATQRMVTSASNVSLGAASKKRRAPLPPARKSGASESSGDGEVSVGERFSSASFPGSVSGDSSLGLVPEPTLHASDVASIDDNIDNNVKTSPSESNTVPASNLISVLPSEPRVSSECGAMEPLVCHVDDEMVSFVEFDDDEANEKQQQLNPLSAEVHATLENHSLPLSLHEGHADSPAHHSPQTPREPPPVVNHIDSSESTTTVDISNHIACVSENSERMHDVSESGDGNKNEDVQVKLDDGPSLEVEKKTMQFSLEEHDDGCEDVNVAEGRTALSSQASTCDADDAFGTLDDLIQEIDCFSEDSQSDNEMQTKQTIITSEKEDNVDRKIGANANQVLPLKNVPDGSKNVAETTNGYLHRVETQREPESKPTAVPSVRRPLLNFSIATYKSRPASVHNPTTNIEKTEPALTPKESKKTIENNHPPETHPAWSRNVILTVNPAPAQNKSFAEKPDDFSEMRNGKSTSLTNLSENGSSKLHKVRSENFLAKAEQTTNEFKNEDYFQLENEYLQLQKKLLYWQQQLLSNQSLLQRQHILPTNDFQLSADMLSLPDDVDAHQHTMANRYTAKASTFPTPHEKPKFFPTANFSSADHLNEADDKCAAAHRHSNNRGAKEAKQVPSLQKHEHGKKFSMAHNDHKKKVSDDGSLLLIKDRTRYVEKSIKPEVKAKPYIPNGIPKKPIVDFARKPEPMDFETFQFVENVSEKTESSVSSDHGYGSLKRSDNEAKSNKFRRQRVEPLDISENDSVIVPVSANERERTSVSGAPVPPCITSAVRKQSEYGVASKKVNSYAAQNVPSKNITRVRVNGMELDLVNGGAGSKKQTVAPQESSRDALFKQIQNFGGKKNLKKVAAYELS